MKQILICNMKATAQVLLKELAVGSQGGTKYEPQSTHLILNNN